MLQNAQDYVRSARLIWADKIALLMGLLFSLLLLFLWSLAFFVVGSLGARHMWAGFGFQGVGLVIVMVGTSWFMMRATDFFWGRVFSLAVPRLASPGRPILGISPLSRDRILAAAQRSPGALTSAKPEQRIGMVDLPVWELPLCHGPRRHIIGLGIGLAPRDS